MEQFALYAGTARQVIPFPENFFPYRAWGPRCLTGEHDALCVRALYLKWAQPVLLVTIETGDVDPAWRERLAAELRLDPSQVFISATHTHTAPYIGGYWPEDVFDREKSELYTAIAWETTVATAREAMSELVPVQAHWRTGWCNVNVNRDVQQVDRHTGKTSYTTGQNFHGYSDKTVRAITFIDEYQRVLAVLFNYAVHSSVLFGTDQKDGGQLASGDLAGAAMRRVEEALDCMAMFAMAPAADQDPRYSGAVMFVDKNGKRHRQDYGLGAFALVESLGWELASEVIALCGKQSSVLLEGLTSETNTVWIPGKVKREGPGVPEPKSPADYEPADPVPVPIGVIRLGDGLIVAVGCEINTKVGLEIEAAMSHLGYEKTYIITQCNGSSSYMADDDCYRKVTFTAKASHMMPGASRYLTRGISELAKSLS